MKRHYVSRITTICKELAEWQADSMSGVDGRDLSEFFLSEDGPPPDFSPQTMQKNSKRLGMDCSTFVFYHYCLAPSNIFVDGAEEPIGITDWEMAGFVPRDWIMTKFDLSTAFDISGKNDPEEWRRRVGEQLTKEGFSSCAEKYFAWQFG
jgi:hypothetical protein